MTQTERDRLLAVLLRIERGDGGASVSEVISLVYRLSTSSQRRSTAQVKGRARRSLETLDRLDRQRASL